MKMAHARFLLTPTGQVVGRQQALVGLVLLIEGFLLVQSLVLDQPLARYLHPGWISLLSFGKENLCGTFL